jgi:hypothetical protein
MRGLLMVVAVAALMIAPLAKPAAVGVGPPLLAGMLIASYGVCQAIQEPRRRPFWSAYLTSVCFYALFFLHAPIMEQNDPLPLVSDLLNYDPWYDLASNEGEEVMAGYVFMFTMQIGFGALLSLVAAGLAAGYSQLAAQAADGD